jgi:hypothetical protein
MPTRTLSPAPRAARLRPLAPALAVLLALSSSASSLPPPPPPGYVAIEELSDEFDGDALDVTKWLPHSPGWPGRAPGLFDAANVVVGGGALQLWARAARRNASWPSGYDNYTTSAVHSVARTRLGFLEIKWRSGSSGVSDCTRSRRAAGRAARRPR